MQISRTPTGLYVGKRKYAMDLLHSYNYLDSKPFPTPCTAKTIDASRIDNYSNPSLVIQFSRPPMDSTKPGSNNKALTDIQGYRSLVGWLVYLTMTRPDITYAINHLSLHMQNPIEHDLKAAHKVLIYCKSSPGLGLLSLGRSPLAFLHSLIWMGHIMPSTKGSMIGSSLWFPGKPKNNIQ